MSNPWIQAGRLTHSVALALLALTVVLAAAPVAAQVNTATIEVVVNDNDNRPLPGVTIRVTSAATGFDQTVVTGESGRARLGAIPPGAYDVAFELSGFAPLVEKNIVLRVAQNLVLAATMQAKLTETVTVTATAPIVDVHKTDTSTNIIPEQIETLPVADRDFQRLSFIAPTVQRERGGFRFITGGPVIGAGGNASQGTILIDGVDITDPALGLATARFSQDAIREFRVIANRYDAEMGGVAGGALSIVTRSGTNQVGGRVFGFFRDKSLRARSALEDLIQPKPDFSRQQFGGVLGGPITKDKAHYFFSLEQIDENNVTLVRPQGLFVAQRVDAKLPSRQTLLFGRVDGVLSQRQRLSAKFAYERYRQDNFRVGGVADVSQGLHMNRDNFNFNAEHTWVGSATRFNQFFVQIGRRKYDEPANTRGKMAEWFTNGTTLQTGGSIYEGLLGEGTYVEFRDTFTLHKDMGRSGTHDFKMGGNWQIVRDRFLFDSYPNGVMLYATDTRALPLFYIYGDGSADSHINTNRIAGYVQDDWAVRRNVRVNLGVRYDVDTKGNNPDFTNWYITQKRGVDKNNIQPRGAISWDVDGTGRNVVRGGVGLFTGRFLLVPPHSENQQNGVTGRKTFRRLNGLVLNLPPAFWLDPNNPKTTGVALPQSIGLLDKSYVAPDSTQMSLGWTSRLGSTGLFFDTEFVYARGRNEITITNLNWPGNAKYTGAASLPYNGVWDIISLYTNAGRSSYKALVMSVNGTLRGGHLLTVSYTLGSKKNINDDFSPDYSTGYPSDPANLEADYGRSRSDERHRVVATAVIHVPYDITVAPIVEYGSGQPWTRRYGYDYNGDAWLGDRPAGVPRFGENGPSFNQVSLRVTKSVRFTGARSVDLIAEAFNLFNTRNDNVSAIDGGMYRSGPTILNPSAPFVANPNFGKYFATLPSREIQLGVRFTF